jgi:polyisoprenoid-binding protein YceI
MHGITREIDVAVTRVAPRSRDMWENTRVGFDGAVTLKREDYGIVGPAFWNKAVTSDVEIRFKRTVAGAGRAQPERARDGPFRRALVAAVQ